MTTKRVLPAFTLVRRALRPGVHDSARRSIVERLREKGLGAGKGLELGDEAFAKALISTVMARQPVGKSESGGFKVTRQATKVIETVARNKKALKVGVVDLSAWVSKLPTLLEMLNASQERFAFFEIQAPLPGGLIKKGDWYTDVAGYELRPKERRELEGQVLAQQFFKAGRSIRANLGLNYLAGVTPTLIADNSRGKLSWNLFSSSDEGILLISTAELRSFAVKAKRSYEAFVANVLVAALLAEANPKIGFHKDTGCIFDYKQQRDRIIESVVDPHIEDRCLKKIEPSNRDAAQNLVKLLRKL